MLGTGTSEAMLRDMWGQVSSACGVCSPHLCTDGGTFQAYPQGLCVVLAATSWSVWEDVFFQT